MQPVDKPVLVDTEESIGKEVEIDRGAVEAESAVIMKPADGAENWVGPASNRRDNIGAPETPGLKQTKQN